MPFVEGVTLDDLIKQRMEKGRGFSEEELLGLLTRVLDALGHLHSRGIYHRDIKPGNILITNDGVPVLIDFGAARQMVSERSMTVIESPGYTPFEQLQSRGNIGPWSDIYALAGTLYKMLTFEAPPKAMDRVRQDPVGNLASDPRLAGRYSNIFLSSIHWAFRFDERERWQSAGDWRGALANAPDILEAPTADTGFSSAATGAKPISRAAEPNPRQVQEPPPLASAQTANQSPPTKQLKHREGDVVNSIIGVVGLCLVLAGPCILLWPLFDRNKGEKAETISESKSIERQSTEVGTAKLPAEKATEVARQAVEPKAGDRMEIEIAPGVKMAFRWCPPGTFMMGSPADEAGREGDETQYRVTLSKGFWLAETEVTQGQWKAVMGNNPSHFTGGDQLPVEQVSWDDTQEFLRKMGLLSGMAVRLPTEAEWEYACRAGTTTVFGHGDRLNGKEGNIDGNFPYPALSSKGPFLKKTVEVGSYPANQWGLRDMHGNVWEWCWDWYGEYPAVDVIDPKGATTGSERVFRGGSWRNSASSCRSANRAANQTGVGLNFVGFRPALVPAR
jgi:formylglycine-generating enzyme required for sulfatase activity